MATAGQVQGTLQGLLLPDTQGAMRPPSQMFFNDADWCVGSLLLLFPAHLHAFDTRVFVASFNVK
jgi:hypothetical protein